MDAYPLVTARNVKRSIIDLELAPEFIREEDYYDWMVRGFPDIGDVVITTEAPLGEVAQIIDTNIALAQRIILLKSNKEIIQNEYIKYWFISDAGQAELYSQATGSTALGIKASKFKAVNILVPEISEQQAITLFLDQETARIDEAIENVRSQIGKLEEYRTVLISDAVTGKIDVRGFENNNENSLF